jgi:translation elongation factor EF-Tu-like GTPase
MDEMGKAENNFAQAILIMDLSESIYGEKRLEVIKAKQSGIKKVLVFIKNDFIKDEDLEELTQMEVETELKNNGLPSEGVTVTGSVNKEDGSTAINDLWEKIVA